MNIIVEVGILNWWLMFMMIANLLLLGEFMLIILLTVYLVS